MVLEGRSARPIHRLLLLNDSSFSFSKKQGHKRLAGILLTAVWESDWIPHRLGIEWEIRGLLERAQSQLSAPQGSAPAR